MMMMMMMNCDFIYVWHHFLWFCDSICVSHTPPTEADPIWNNFPRPRWLLKALYHPSTFISGPEAHPECQLSVTSCQGSGSASWSRAVWRANFRGWKMHHWSSHGGLSLTPSLARALQRRSSCFLSINIILSKERIKLVKQPGLGGSFLIAVFTWSSHNKSQIALQNRGEALVVNNFKDINKDAPTLFDRAVKRRHVLAAHLHRSFTVHEGFIISAWLLDISLQTHSAPPPHI